MPKLNAYETKQLNEAAAHVEKAKKILQGVWDRNDNVDLSQETESLGNIHTKLKKGV